MDEELEILKSIYFDDITNVNLNKDQSSFEILISPTNTNNDEDNRKSLILTLIVNFDEKEYPNKRPEFKFKNVRGVIDEDIQKIYREIIEIAEKNIGNLMLFEIIQHIREFLGHCGNVPKSCACSICLSELEKDDETTHLECYHYFHKLCLITHIQYVEKDIENEKQEAARNKLKWKERFVFCPVCREPIDATLLKEYHSCDLRALKGSKHVSQNDNEVVFISDKMRKLQMDMRVLYEKQKSIGGIIENKEQEIIVLNRPTPGTETDSLSEDQLNLS